jgi:hypothetical protein
LCSGAHASFHAGLELEGLSGLLVINPIVFYWKPSDPLDVAAWRTFLEARYYKQSALRLSSWRRLLTGRVNIPHMASVGVRRSGEILRAKYASALRSFRRENIPTEHAPRDLERIAARGTDVLLLFSEGDPGLDFLRLNYGRELRRISRVPGFRLQVLDAADHTFTSIDARRRARDVLTGHLLEHHS